MKSSLKKTSLVTTNAIVLTGFNHPCRFACFSGVRTKKDIYHSFVGCVRLGLSFPFLRIMHYCVCVVEFLLNPLYSEDVLPQNTLGRSSEWHKKKYFFYLFNNLASDKIPHSECSLSFVCWFKECFKNTSADLFLGLLCSSGLPVRERDALLIHTNDTQRFCLAARTYKPQFMDHQNPFRIHHCGLHLHIWVCVSSFGRY